MVQQCLLPTISEILSRTIDFTVQGENDSKINKRIKAEREWLGAIAALENLLLLNLDYHDKINGLILTSPVPIFNHNEVISHYKTAILTPDIYHPLALMPAKYSEHKCLEDAATISYSLPILPGDNIASEQFCIILTKQFSLVMVLGDDELSHPAFQFSFDPEVIMTALQTLRQRLCFHNYDYSLHNLAALINQFLPVQPDYKLVSQFSRLLLKYLPENQSENVIFAEIIPQSNMTNNQTNDIELLAALTHEVRTPLTTIKTLTKLLLKRKDLAQDIVRRLEIIENECSEQINRMELIFRAVELQKEEQESNIQLTAMSVTQVFNQSIPRWKNAAERRNLTLEVNVPQNLPQVVSNPNMLDQILTGVIENFTRNIASGGHIQVTVTPTGDQLKLQLESDQDGNYEKSGCKYLGKLLTFQPETGVISLNLNVTKNLFQALGGKLIVRQRSHQGEVLTIFLPLH